MWVTIAFYHYKEKLCFKNHKNNCQSYRFMKTNVAILFKYDEMSPYTLEYTWQIGNEDPSH